MSRAPWTLIAALSAGLAAAACGEVDNPYRPLPEPDFEAFVQDIQPLIGRHCAAVGCHGSPDRGLSLFAVGYLRAPPSFAGAPLDERALTSAELAWNYDGLRLRLIDEVDADRARLLLKCLAPSAGGVTHAQGFVAFERREDPEYRALRDWIAGALR